MHRRRSTSSPNVQYRKPFKISWNIVKTSLSTCWMNWNILSQCTLLSILKNTYLDIWQCLPGRNPSFEMVSFLALEKKPRYVWIWNHQVATVFCVVESRDRDHKLSRLCFLKGPEKRKLSEGKEQDSFLDKRSWQWWRWRCCSRRRRRAAIGGLFYVLSRLEAVLRLGYCCCRMPVRLSSKAASARTAIGLLQQRMAEQLAAVGLRCRTQGGIFTQQRKCTKGQEATSSSTSASTLSSSEGETPTDSSRGTTTTTLLLPV